MLFYLIIWMIFGIIGYNMGQKKNMGPYIASLICFLLGLIGLAIVYFSSDKEQIEE